MGVTEWVVKSGIRLALLRAGRHVGFNPGDNEGVLRRRHRTTRTSDRFLSDPVDYALAGHVSR
jgi:hypothetical protein